MGKVNSFILCICILCSKISLSQTGAALNFDGFNDYVYIPHNPLLKPSNYISIEAWIYANNIHTTTYSEIYRKEDGNARHLLSFQNNGTILSFGLETGGVYSELDVPISTLNYEGQWVHVAATYDGSVKKIYRNGVLIGSQFASGVIGTAGSAPSFIGSLAGSSEFFQGSIDEVRLWNKPLSQSEIQSGMNCELSQQANLILYYKFNQGIAGAANTGNTQLIDFSGNSIVGVLINFALIGGNSNWATPGGIVSNCSCAGPQISIGITDGSSATCSGSQVTFGIIQSSNIFQGSIQWKKNGVDIPGATSSSYSSNNLSDADLISCRLMNNVACASPTVALSNNIAMEIAASEYTFNGNGSWQVPNNWVNNARPPSVLPPCSKIIIDPAGNGECILDTLIYVHSGSSITVKENKVLKIVSGIGSISSLIDTLTDIEDSLVALSDGFTFQLSDSVSVPSNLPSSESIEQYTALQLDIFKAAVRLTDTINRKDLSFPNEGSNRPAQKGLAYVCSNHNYYAIWSTERFRNNYDQCIEYLHGLECNGFLSRILMDAGVRFDNNYRLPTATFADTGVLNRFLRANPNHKHLKYNPGKRRLNKDSIKTGDIIYWKKPDGRIFHVGVCFRNYVLQDGLYIFQSNGSPSDCVRNKAQNGRGPHAVKFSSIITWQEFGEYYISQLSADSSDEGSFTDPRDGQVYTYKRIGSQTWMTKNLNYAAPGSICHSNNAANCNIYGRLYNFDMAKSAIAPPGWHVPNDAEWNTLINYLGGSATAGGSMKTTSGWALPNIGATNSSGFNALPGGYLSYNGSFYYLTEHGNWWSVTEINSTTAWNRWITNDSQAVNRGTGQKNDYIAIRCVKDN